MLVGQYLNMFFSCCITSTHQATAEHVADTSEYGHGPYVQDSQTSADEEMSKNGMVFECELPTAGVGGKLGLEVEAWSQALQVVQLGHAVEDYNASAPRDRQIQVNDFILRVNGSSGVKSMEDKLQREKTEMEDTLTLTIARPTRICLPTIHKSYGFKLSYKRGATLMAVADMVAGGLTKYNATASPKSKVQTGDFIAEVNGTIGSATAMHDTLKAAVAAELTILKVPILS